MKPKKPVRRKRVILGEGYPRHYGDGFKVTGIQLSGTKGPGGGPYKRMRILKYEKKYRLIAEILS